MNNNHNLSDFTVALKASVEHLRIAQIFHVNLARTKMAYDV